MSAHLDQMRDQQRETWDRFSAGWKKWDALVLGWLAPFGEAMIRLAAIKDGYHHWSLSADREKASDILID